MNWTKWYRTRKPPGWRVGTVDGKHIQLVHASGAKASIPRRVQEAGPGLAYLDQRLKLAIRRSSQCPT